MTALLICAVVIVGVAGFAWWAVVTKVGGSIHGGDE